MTFFAYVLQNLKTNQMQILNLNAKQLNGLQMQQLCKVLVHNTSLKEIDLGFNMMITDFGAMILARTLKYCCHPNLESLKLNFCRIGDDGVRELATMIASIPTLTKLDLSDNEIGVDGAIALAEAIKYHPGLKELNLSYNSIGDQGIIAISEALKFTCIKSLQINYVQIGRKGLEVLMQHSTHLNDFHFKTNQIDLVMIQDSFHKKSMGSR